MPNLADLRSPMPVNAGHSLNNGRVGWWMVTPGRDAGSVWRDMLGRNNGTLTNMGGGSSGFRKVISRAGGFGEMRFDGVDDYVITPSLTRSSTGFSVAAWAYANGSQGTFARLVEASFSSWFYLGANSPGTSWLFYLDNNPIITGNTILANAWTRLLITYNGANASMYENGMQTGTSNPVSFNAATLPIYFGKAFNASSNYWKGTMDDVSLWSRALSAAEARQDYELSRLGYPGVLHYPPRFLRQFFKSGNRRRRLLCAGRTV